MSAYTLTEYLADHRARGGAFADEVVATIAGLAKGAVALREAVTLGALGTAFSGTRNNGNAGAGGDVPKDLDHHADALILEAIRDTPVALYASEELDHPIVLNKSAPLALATDPLDGSSNIDTNVSIGTIFSILPVKGAPDLHPLESFLQPGRNQLAGGFFVYGPQLALAVSLGAGTDIFVYSPRLETFVRAYASVSIPHATQEFAINVSNYRFWDDGIRHYVDDCKKGATGPHGRDFNMRWIASMVADAYRILIRGGVYLYPGDSRKGYGNGRLRLVYEANPVAMLMEQAGALATDTKNPILDRVPTSLHEKVPLVFGSRDEVIQIRHYLTDQDPVGLRSPLFGSRGLFRN
ncbi:MAG: class 1 fructose-bisphosphatase [Devosia sp.]